MVSIPVGETASPADVWCVVELQTNLHLTIVKAEDLTFELEPTVDTEDVDINMFFF